MAPLAALAGRLPAAVFLVCSVSADLVAVAGHDPIGIWRYLPAGPVAGSWINAEVSSTALLLVAMSLLRGKCLGWWLALALLVAAAIVQGLVHGHPVAGMIAVLMIAILVATRARYVARTGRTELQLAIGLLGLGAVVVVVDGLAAGPPATALPHAGRLLGSWLDGGSIGRASLTAGLSVMLVGARLAFVAAAALVLDPASDPRTPAELVAARSALERHGRGSLLPYQLGPTARPFGASNGEGALAYGRAGRTAVALGDPSGSPTGAVMAWTEWLAMCRMLDWEPVLYQASESLAERLHHDGWHAVRVGSEAVLDPTAFDAGTPTLANVRHTVTRARRGGLRAWSSRRGTAALPGAASVERLRQLDAEWRRAAGPSLGFTVGEFDPATLGGCLVVAATGPDDRLAAFVVLRPTGADGGWMLDLMRRRRDGTPGAIELCLVTAIEELARLGVGRLSLGLAPLAGLRLDRGPLDERLLAAFAAAAARFYDVRGLAFFKDKFGVRWEPRYLCVTRPWGAIGAGLALLRLHLGGSWPRVVRSIAAPVTTWRRDPTAR